jgi:hypothetical protein
MAGRGNGQGNPPYDAWYGPALCTSGRKKEGAIILLGVPFVWVFLNIFDLGN